MREIKKVRFFINNINRDSDLAKLLMNDLIDNNFQLVNDNTYDLGIIFGGDGSFLKMLREEKFDYEKYYIGINTGKLGFLQEINHNSTSEFLKNILRNNYQIDELQFFDVIVEYQDNSKEEYHSLNEIVIRKDDLSVLSIKVMVDGQLLENFVGDGLLISTQTGSTAYNLSLGGSIIYNTLKAYTITPIASIRNCVYNPLINPIILPSNKNTLLECSDDDLIMLIDGKSKKLENVSKIEIKMARDTIKCLRMNDYHFIKVVHNKIVKN